MAGGHDPANRGAFPWYTADAWDKDLLHDFQRMIALRRSRPALRRGSFQIVAADDDVLAHVRQLGHESIIVVLNTAHANRRVDVPVSGLVPDGTGFEEVWSRDSTRVEAGALRSVELAPRSGRVFATPA